MIIERSERDTRSPTQTHFEWKQRIFFGCVRIIFTCPVRSRVGRTASIGRDKSLTTIRVTRTWRGLTPSKMTAKRGEGETGRIRGKITTYDGHCARSADRTDNAMCRLQRIAAAWTDTVVVRHVCTVIIIIIRFGVWRDGGVLKKNKPFPAERFYAARAHDRTGGLGKRVDRFIKTKKKCTLFLRVSFFFFIDTWNRSSLRNAVRK